MSVAWMEIEFAPGARLTVHEKPELERTAAAPLQATEAIPEILSVSDPLIPIEDVLSAIVEPLAGDAMDSMGGVLSSFTVTEVFAVFPAESVATPETTRPATSLEIL